MTDGKIVAILASLAITAMLAGGLGLGYVTALLTAWGV